MSQLSFVLSGCLLHLFFNYKPYYTCLTEVINSAIKIHHGTVKDNLYSVVDSGCIVFSLDVHFSTLHYCINTGAGLVLRTR